MFVCSMFLVPTWFFLDWRSHRNVSTSSLISRHRRRLSNFAFYVTMWSIYFVHQNYNRPASESSRTINNFLVLPFNLSTLGGSLRYHIFFCMVHLPNVGGIQLLPIERWCVTHHFLKRLIDKWFCTSIYNCFCYMTVDRFVLPNCLMFPFCWFMFSVLCFHLS